MLRLLGGVALESPEGALGGHLVQRHRLALLALLAASPSGLSRDKLFGYLWPDSDTKHARHLLDQSVYVLRRGLGEAALETRGGQVRLNPEVVESDIAIFQCAIKAGNLEQAVCNYGGLFLDGFFLPNAVEFEHWAAGERERLAGMHGDALTALVDRAAAAGDGTRAVEWARRLVAHDPLATRAALRLMLALDGMGERGNALRAARTFAAGVQEEIGIDADETYAGLIAHLTPTAPAATPPRVANPIHETSGFPPSGAQVVLERSRRSRATWSASLAAGLAALALGAWVASRNSSSAASVNTVAVLPFAVSGTSTSDYLSEGMVDLLSVRLDEADNLRTADPRAILAVAGNEQQPVGPEHGQHIANRLNAGAFVLGSVVETGDQLQISATLYRGEKPQTAARAAVDGRRDDLAALVDRLAAQLLVALHKRPGEQLVQTAGTTTTSFAALKAYLEGTREFRAGRYAAAAEAFGRATQADTGYALAYYGLASALEWAGQGSAHEVAAEEAARRADRLPWRERQLLEALRLVWRNELAEAERRYRALVNAYPDDVEAWYRLGELRFHSGPVRGQSITAAREPFEQVLRFEPNNREALVHLLRIAAKERRTPQVKTLAERAISLSPPGEVLELRAFRAFALRDRVEQARILPALERLDGETVFTLIRFGAVYTEDLIGTQRAAQVLAVPAQEVRHRSWGYYIAADLALARGRVHEAREALQGMESIDREAAMHARALASSLPFLPAPRSVLEANRAALVELGPTRQTPLLGTYEYFGIAPDQRALLRQYLLALLSVRLKDFGSATRYADSLHAANSAAGQSAPIVQALEYTIRAEVARGQGQTTAALEWTEKAMFETGFSHLTQVIGSQAHLRFLRAELLGDLGRVEEALRWYSTLGQIGTHELVYLAPSKLRQAEIYERLGNHAEATRHYTQLIELWQHGEPEVRPAVLNARRHLARLSRVRT